MACYWQCATTLFAIVLFFVSTIATYSSQPWYSIPLRLTANGDHFVTRMSFGEPAQYSLDIVMDTGSGKFHIYQHSQNNHSEHNIVPSDTDSFECVCQFINTSAQDYLLFSNETWFTVSNDSSNSTGTGTHTSLLKGCPSFNSTLCDLKGRQCKLDTVSVHYDISSTECASLPSVNNTDECTVAGKVCMVNPAVAVYRLTIDGDEAAFPCTTSSCYSAVDVVSFAEVPDPAHAAQSIAFVHADTNGVTLDDYNQDGVLVHSLQSWSDGLMGLVYDYEQQTAFWKLLNAPANSALVALDTLAQRMDVGGVDAAYESRVQFGENIWWGGTYHYFYMYSLSLCAVDVFGALDIGAYYLAMIDTGATCLTLPAEMFDLVFEYIPFDTDRDCNENHTFCYLPSDMNASSDVDAFPMFSFQLSLNGAPLYVSLKDLVIHMPSDDDDDDPSLRYCIMRSSNSVTRVGECEPHPQFDNSNSHADCTANALIIFGTQVLRSLYTVLDYPHKRVGFGNNLIANYSARLYDSVSKHSCASMQNDCIGDDVLNIISNECDSTAANCDIYWAWHYNDNTHRCVLQSWLCALIVLAWLLIAICMLLFIKSKQWIDENVFYTAIKV